MKIFFINLDMLFMFISGVLLMDYFNIPWSYFRTIEFLHVFGSIAVIVLFVLPFLYKHIYESMVQFKHKSLSGVLFGLVFFIIIVSGIYLFLVGNRGGDSIEGVKTTV